MPARQFEAAISITYEVQGKGKTTEHKKEKDFEW